MMSNKNHGPCLDSHPTVQLQCTDPGSANSLKFCMVNSVLAARWFVLPAFKGHFLNLELLIELLWILLHLLGSSPAIAPHACHNGHKCHCDATQGKADDIQHTCRRIGPYQLCQLETKGCKGCDTSSDSLVTNPNSCFDKQVRSPNLTKFS